MSMGDHICLGGKSSYCTHREPRNRRHRLSFRIRQRRIYPLRTCSICIRRLRCNRRHRLSFRIRQQRIYPLRTCSICIRRLRCNRRHRLSFRIRQQRIYASFHRTCSTCNRRCFRILDHHRVYRFSALRKFLVGRDSKRSRCRLCTSSHRRLLPEHICPTRSNSKHSRCFAYTYRRFCPPTNRRRRYTIRNPTP